ncbi:MAG: hypothetical protein SFZ03_11360 [Candidatus Melainabacteria bacterium]|nr:hypothetical protein [Candidatus Melainabacteria bacterium]
MDMDVGVNNSSAPLQGVVPRRHEPSGSDRLTLPTDSGITRPSEESGAIVSSSFSFTGSSGVPSYNNTYVSATEGPVTFSLFQQKPSPSSENPGNHLFDLSSDRSPTINTFTIDGAVPISVASGGGSVEEPADGFQPSVTVTPYIGATFTGEPNVSLEQGSREAYTGASVEVKPLENVNTGTYASIITGGDGGFTYSGARGGVFASAGEQGETPTISAYAKTELKNYDLGFTHQTLEIGVNGTIPLGDDLLTGGVKYEELSTNYGGGYTGVEASVGYTASNGTTVNVIGECTTPEIGGDSNTTLRIESQIPID